MASAIGILNTAFPAAEPGREPSRVSAGFNKVPEVVLTFWVIKIAATTLGETGGDAFSMSLGLGYLISTAIFSIAFAAVVVAQIKANTFRPFLYWSVVIASTTVGTTLADYATRSIGIGYIGGSLLLLTLLLLSLAVWYRAVGSVSVSSIKSHKTETFYWVTILFSQTLGTALGDFAADVGGLGYAGGALVFGAVLFVVAALYRFTSVSRVLLFWIAFVLTRPLGATVGDYLDKPIANGGLALDRFSASAVLLVFIVLCVLIFPQRAEPRPNRE